MKEICEVCNDTKMQQCTPACPQVIFVKGGRGWHCDVDARYHSGCPPCDECSKGVVVTFDTVQTGQRLVDSFGQECVVVEKRPHTVVTKRYGDEDDWENCIWTAETFSRRDWNIIFGSEKNDV